MSEESERLAALETQFRELLALYVQTSKECLQVSGLIPSNSLVATYG
jgi:hypothetical protein